MAENGNLFWLDLETTGLNPRECKILEVGVVVTDAQLNELFAASTLVQFAVGPATFDRINPKVLEMHQKNGIWDELASPDVPKIGYLEIANWLSLIADGMGCSKGEGYLGSPLCGSSIHFDRSFLQVHAPAFLQRISYRNIDVSSVHEICMRWFDTHHETTGEKPHRALDDIKFSIDRLRWYRARHFNPHGRKREPGCLCGGAMICPVHGKAD